MEDSSPFEIRSYGKSELASLYLPLITPDSAARSFRRWIQKYPGLQEALAATGFDDSHRRFTPIQVKLIVEALGLPG